jgi:hypothetical protein
MHNSHVKDTALASHNARAAVKGCPIGPHCILTVVTSLDSSVDGVTTTAAWTESPQQQRGRSHHNGSVDGVTTTAAWTESPQQHNSSVA